MFEPLHPYISLYGVARTETHSSRTGIFPMFYSVPIYLPYPLRGASPFPDEGLYTSIRNLELLIFDWTFSLGS